MSPNRRPLRQLGGGKRLQLSCMTTATLLTWAPPSVVYGRWPPGPHGRPNRLRPTLALSVVAFTRPHFGGRAVVVALEDVANEAVPLDRARRRARPARRRLLRSRRTSGCRRRSRCDEPCRRHRRRGRA